MTHDPDIVSPASSATDRLLFTLDNGLRVVIQEDHFAPVVAIQIWVKAGSADETPDVAGAAHVHEHMIFKGTTRRPVGAIAAEVESSGGHINAFTTADHTVYHLILASRHFATGLDILADAMQHTTFDPHELGKELQVVMEEWKRGEDSPTSRAATELFRLAYTTHPYGRPVIGYRETIEALNRERVLNFYQRWYRPNNMTLVIVGDIEREAARQEVLRIFAGQPTVPLPSRPRTPEPPHQGLRLSVLDMNVEEFYLYLAFPLPPATHEDVFALDLLSYILGGGESSRLVQTLQADKELVNWISAHAYTPQDPGLFIVAAALEQDKVRPALEEILATLFRCKPTLVSPAELARARTNLESDFIYRRETVQGQARQLGFFLTVFGDPDYESQYLDGLAAVTRQDLQRVAQRYFSPASLSLVLLGATTGATLPTTAEVQTLCARLDTEPTLAPLPLTKRDGQVSFTVLDNGVRLIVKEHHAVPVMALQAVMLGGLLFEDEHNLGVNNMLAGLLTRGSERFSRLELAEAVESLAGSLRGFSGRNSLGLSGSFLTTPRIDNALDLFLDTLLHPAFPTEEVSVVGDVDTEQVTAHLREALRLLPAAVAAPTLPPTDPRPTTARQCHKAMDKQQAHIVLGFQGVTLANPDRYPLKVLEAILSRQGGRLFYELREQRALAYSVAAFGVEGLAPGVVGVYVGTDPNKVEEATTAARVELARVREELVSAAELEQARKYLTGSFEISLQSNSAQSEEMAFNELYGLGYENGRRYLAAITAVTAEDLRRVARTYFADNASTLVVVGR